MASEQKREANGYVVTTFKKSLGRFTPRGTTVYATAKDALAVAKRVDGSYVDWASPYGLSIGAAPEDSARAGKPEDKQNLLKREASDPSQVSA